MAFLRDYIDDLRAEGYDVEVNIVYEDGITRTLGRASEPDLYELLGADAQLELIDGYYPDLYEDGDSVDVYVRGLCQDEFLVVHDLLDAMASSSTELADYMVHLTSQSDGSTVFGAVDDWRFEEYDDYLVLAHYVVRAEESKLGVDTVTIICE